ncbi:MAG: hypothetical protein HQ569_05280 [Actinobacteria bacterium]|nr:hypothetical protein [Actinomycetota bacterium]
MSLSPNPGEKFDNYNYTKKDKQILRELAEKKAEIASSEINSQKIKMWEALNDLKQVRPLVWINEIPWHEMNVDDELTLKTSNNFTKILETRLRRTIYRWNHMRADMVVEPTMPCYLEVKNTGFGISEVVSVAKTDKESAVYSRGFQSQIDNEEDIEKIKNPKVIYFKEDTDAKFDIMEDIFNGILKVEKSGYPGFWFSPWDELIRWWSVEKLLTDLIMRPELVHKTIKRLVDAYLFQLDQYEELDLLALNNCNYRIGSGGLGYTKELPSKNFNPNKIKAKDLWGNSTAQIFSDVSPDMHNEFAIRYEVKWMERFGLNYYGCCEPLHKKIDILKKVPNLRKISISQWANLEIGAKNIGRDYVFSYKLSPSIFVYDTWDADSMKRKLTENLKKIKDCNVEILMKDISTVKYKPQRLWEWTKIAMEVVNSFVS